MRLLSIFIVLITLASHAIGQVQATRDFDQPPQQDLAKAVQIFPNPAVEFVHVRLDHVNLDGATVSVHNIIGNEINIDTERISEHEIRIKVKDFDAGYYLLAINDSQSKFRGIYKFLKR